MSETSPIGPEPRDRPPQEHRCPLCGSPDAAPHQATPAALQQWLGRWISRRLGVLALPEGFRLSVVIPVYNERATIAEIIRRVQAVEVPKEIVVVDDGSTDGTREVLAGLAPEPGLCVVYHEQNLGKGAALRTGFGRATGDVVIVQDADLEYDPAEYPRLIQPIVEGVADVVYGSRFLSDGPHRVLYFWHSAANRFLTALSNMFTDLNLTDVETCYKVFRREVVQAIAPTLKQRGFGIELELTSKVARGKYRIYETGISYFGRTYQEGKKIGLRDALHAVWCVFRYWRWD